jgi:hypothetical protein
MNLGDIKTAYEDLSSKASDIVRQLSLAGIALVWVLKSTSLPLGSRTSYALPPQLMRAALCVVLALTLDLLQYLIGTSIWFIYFRYKERRGISAEEQFNAPTSLNWPAWCLFYSKTVFLMIAYVKYLIPFLWTTFSA